MRVKICGITRPEDARFAEQQGADAIGVIVFSDGVSQRVVGEEKAREIFDAVGPFTTTVAVSHTKSEDELEADDCTASSCNPDLPPVQV